MPRLFFHFNNIQLLSLSLKKKSLFSFRKNHGASSRTQARNGIAFHCRQDNKRHSQLAFRLSHWALHRHRRCDRMKYNLHFISFFFLSLWRVEIECKLTSLNADFFAFHERFLPNLGVTISAHIALSSL